VRAVVRGALGLMVVLAAVPAFAGQIGFLDAERAVLSVQEGKSQLKLLEEWATPRKNHIDELKGQVAALNEQIAAQQATLSAEALAQLQGQLVKAQRHRSAHAIGLVSNPSPRRNVAP